MDNKQETITKFQKHANDTGSAAVQVAILSARIKELTEHLKQFKKDYASKKSMINMVHRRKKWLRYIEKNEPSMLQPLLEKLNIRK